MKVYDQGFGGIGDVFDRMLNTIGIHPSRNTVGISLFGHIKPSGTVQIVGGQKSLNPTKDEGLPPNCVHIATLSGLRPKTALKIPYSQFWIFAILIGKGLAYGGPDHDCKYYHQMTYTLHHGGIFILGCVYNLISEFMIQKKHVRRTYGRLSTAAAPGQRSVFST